MPKDESTQQKQSQLEKFQKAAREVETDDREEAFDAIVKKIAKLPPANTDGEPKRRA